MEARELRIGNWVNDRSESIFNREIGETQVSHETIYHMACNKYHKIEPIELTEEWLLKFGFDKLRNNESCYHKGNYSVSFWGSGAITFDAWHRS